MLGERLLASRAITPSQLQVALEAQRTSGTLLGEALLALNLVSEHALASALAQEAGVPFLTVNDMRFDPAAVALVPEAFARQHLITPLDLTETSLRVLQANPFDVVALDELERLSGRRLSVACGTRSDVTRLIERSYGERDDEGALVKDSMAALDEQDHYRKVAESAVARLIDRLLGEAVSRGATDLLVEPEEEVVGLRYRVDGVFAAGETVPKELLPSLVSRMKVMAGLDPSEPRLPQAGRVARTINGRRVDLHVSTLPTVFGEKVAIRLVERDRLIRGLGDLGFSKRNLALFEDVLGRSRGLVLVTGPTGAGKSTTLYSALAHLGSRGKDILTVEDPIEYELPSIRQTQVMPKAGFPFATAVRSLLRQDSDVIMIDEIRDTEAAQVALHAALSGVLVFSTLHTPDAAEALPRLMDMGLEPYLVASGVVAVIAQRLLRLTCPDCRVPATYPPESLVKVGLNPDPGFTFYRGKGCERCHATGYRGRTGAFEILTVDAAIQTLIRKCADSRFLRAAAGEAGMKTLVAEALQKAIFGQTTINEVLKVACE